MTTYGAVIGSLAAPFTAITVPVDESSQAQLAVEYAITLAHGGGTIHFCSVVDTAAAGGVPGVAFDAVPLIDALEDEAKHVAAAAVERAHRSGIVADAAVVFGATAPAIARFARECGSDAILMCTHARTGFARAIAGSVTEGVLKFARVPVVITHAGDDLVSAGPITVAIDGSRASRAALATAISIAATGKNALSIVHVFEPGLPWPEVTEMLASAADDAGNANIDFELVTLRGHVAETIVAAAQRHGSPMIVMGTHGRSGLARIALGSVAAAVIERAAVPVTVVRKHD